MKRNKTKVIGIDSFSQDTTFISKSITKSNNNSMSMILTKNYNHMLKNFSPANNLNTKSFDITNESVKSK